MLKAAGGHSAPEELNRISAGALLKDLPEMETWGAYLEKGRAKSEKGWVTAIGTFIRFYEKVIKVKADVAALLIFFLL